MIKYDLFVIVYSNAIGIGSGRFVFITQANSQTERHLTDWSKHTTNYATSMNSAVQALSSVVDEIENKLSK